MIRRWRRLRQSASTPTAPGEPLEGLDRALTQAARLLAAARARGHHNDAERLRRWIDACLDQRLRHTSDRSR